MGKTSRVRTTGALNKAERFVLQLCLANPRFNRHDLCIPVCEKLGISTAGYEYADVEEPKLPPEYETAIRAALDTRWQMRKERRT